MNNDFDTIKQFEQAFGQRVVAVAHKWGLDEDAAKTDPRIRDIRISGESIRIRTLTDLARIANKSAYRQNHAPYFEALKSPDYKPTLLGIHIQENTAEHADAIKLLKDFAFDIGTTVSRQQEAIIQTQEAKIRATEKETSAVLAYPSADAISVEDASWSDWEQASMTIPAGLDRSEKDRFEEEARDIARVVANGSRYHVDNYIAQTLAPRLQAIKNEMDTRRRNYSTEEAFALGEGPIIDFKAALDQTMIAALIKTEPSINATSSPYPELVQDASGTEPTVNVTERLRILKSNLVNRAETMPAAELNIFNDEQLVPTIRNVEAEVKRLKEAGHQPKNLAAREQHLSTLREGQNIIMHKLVEAGVKSVPTLTEVVRDDAPAPKRPAASIDEQLETIRQRIDKAVAARSGADLRDVYDNILKPKIAEIVGDINKLKSAGHNPELLAIKQRHLSVIKEGATSAFAKITAEAEASARQEASVAIRSASARIAAEPLRLGAGPVSSMPWFKAIMNEAARADMPKSPDKDKGDYPVAVLSGVENKQKEPVLPAPENVPNGESLTSMLRKPSAEAIAAAPRIAKTVKFTEITVPDTDKTAVQEEPKKTPWWKKAAVAVGSVVMASAVAFLSFAIGLDHAQEQKAAERAAKYAAMNDFNGAAQANGAFAQEPMIVVSTPANANNKAAATTFNKVDRPAPVVKTADVTAVKTAFTDADYSAGEAPQAKKVSTPKAKADFRPVAAVNDADVTYKDAIIAKPFDIATSRIKADTWSNACADFKARGIQNSVCPS